MLMALIAACTAASQQVAIAGQYVLEAGSAAERRRKKKQLIDELPLMRNLFTFRERPQLPLPHIDRFSQMMADPSRNVCHKLTHLYAHEFAELAELLHEEIAAARETSWRPDVKNKGQHGKGRPPKYDTTNRLLFVLEWLATGDVGNRAEFTNNYAKTSCVEDKKHVLRAINKVLKDEIKWPTAEERALHYSTYHGIFFGCVGIFDVTEWIIAKPKNRDREHRTFSGKANSNTMKTLAVINKHGYFIWYDPLVDGRRNDRDMFTSSDLYLSKGTYFSPMANGGIGGFEFMASDGGFRGNGPLLFSFDNLDDAQKEIFNLAFKEVRVGVENAVGRVQKWFPILGLQKSYWNYDQELLELAVGAAMKLHNWMLRTRGIRYNAEEDPQHHFRDLY